MKTDDAQEVLHRVRRIETKLSRLIAGEPDRGVTTVSYELRHVEPSLHELHLHTTNVTIQQVVEIFAGEGLAQGDTVDVFDDGRYVITFEISE